MKVEHLSLLLLLLSKQWRLYCCKKNTTNELSCPPCRCTKLHQLIHNWCPSKHANYDSNYCNYLNITSANQVAGLGSIFSKFWEHVWPWAWVSVNKIKLFLCKFSTHLSLQSSLLISYTITATTYSTTSTNSVVMVINVFLQLLYSCLPCFHYPFYHCNICYCYHRRHLHHDHQHPHSSYLFIIVILVSYLIVLASSST